MEIIFYSLVTSIIAGAKAHKARVAKQMISANVFGLIGITGYVVATISMFV